MPRRHRDARYGIRVNAVQPWLIRTAMICPASCLTGITLKVSGARNM